MWSMVMYLEYSEISRELLVLYSKELGITVLDIKLVNFFLMRIFGT